MIYFWIKIGDIQIELCALAHSAEYHVHVAGSGELLVVFSDSLLRATMRTNPFVCAHDTRHNDMLHTTSACLPVAVVSIEREQFRSIRSSGAAAQVLDSRVAKAHSKVQGFHCRVLRCRSAHD